MQLEFKKRLAKALAGIEPEAGTKLPEGGDYFGRVFKPLGQAEGEE